MSITSFFERLGAPLKNPRRSWGAVRRTDGAVFLRVWQDQKFIKDKVMFMMLTHREKYSDDSDNFGYRERLDHVQLVENGTRCFMIMCLADDHEASPRKIKSYNSKDLFVGGELKDRCGDLWIQVERRIPVAEAGLSMIAKNSSP